MGEDDDGSQRAVHNPYKARNDRLDVDQKGAGKTEHGPSAEYQKRVEHGRRVVVHDAESVAR